MKWPESYDKLDKALASVAATIILIAWTVGIVVAILFYFSN